MPKKKNLKKKNGKLTNKGKRKKKNLLKTITELEKAIKKREGRLHYYLTTENIPDEIKHLKKRLGDARKKLTSLQK